MVFMCNLYRNRVAALCAEDSAVTPPQITHQIAAAFSFLTKDNTTDFAETLFHYLSGLFVNVALALAPHISREKNLRINLYFLVKPLYQISRKNKKYLDFETNPRSDTANRYFNIWQHIVLHNVRRALMRLIVVGVQRVRPNRVPHSQTDEYYGRPAASRNPHATRGVPLWPQHPGVSQIRALCSHSGDHSKSRIGTAPINVLKT